MAKLRFTDDSTIDILWIIGGPRVIDEVERDVLSIEIKYDPAKSAITGEADEAWANPETAVSTVEAIFQDQTLLKTLKFVYEDGSEAEIGEYYCKLLTCHHQTRKVKPAAGKVADGSTVEVIIVELAQLTQEEIDAIDWGDSDAG